MPELGSIDMGPGQDGMDPIPLLQEQVNQQLSGLDQEWSQKYQQLNKMYDWSRHEKYPDEITRLRGRLEQDIAGRREQTQAGHASIISKFKMLDELFPDNPQQANKLKWTAAVGKDVANQMFPEQRDPRLEHQRNLAAQNRALDTVAAYVIDNGKLYHAKTKKVGNALQLTDKADTSKPATQGEVQLWSMSKDAVSALEQEELGILGQLSDAGIPDPVYLQSLLVKERRESWFKRFAAGTPGQYAFGGGISRKKTFGPEPTGTFAQKVQEDVVKPQPRVQQPSTGKKLTREIAMRYLMSHPDRQEAMAAARLDGYTE